VSAWVSIAVLHKLDDRERWIAHNPQVAGCGAGKRSGALVSLSSGLHAAGRRNDRGGQGDLEVRGAESTSPMVAYRPLGVESECLCFHKKVRKTPGPCPLATPGQGQGPAFHGPGRRIARGSRAIPPRDSAIRRSAGACPRPRATLGEPAVGSGARNRFPRGSVSASTREDRSRIRASDPRNERAGSRLSAGDPSAENGYCAGFVSTLRKSAVIRSSSCSLSSTLRRFSSC
jgi:hypothetical protein